MSTGLIGGLQGTGNLSYTATSDAKVIVTFSGAGSMAQFSVNNVSNAVVAAANTTIQLTFYVAAGQTLTITSPSTGVVFISSLESY